MYGGKLRKGLKNEIKNIEKGAKKKGKLLTPPYSATTFGSCNHITNQHYDHDEYEEEQ